MSQSKTISSALISVFSKNGLEPIVKKLKDQGVTIYSTGGTQKFINDLGIEVVAVEAVTDYPSILGGRVKTLHPKVFGGILNRQDNDSDVREMDSFNIPQIDLVIVDLYPFEKTVASDASHQDIIEKIDIGGISLIRAAAKNFKDVMCVSSVDDYSEFLELLSENNGAMTYEDRQRFAAKSFNVSSHYDSAIFNYFNTDSNSTTLKLSETDGTVLRYGENPHQKGYFFGDFEGMFEKLHGKALSYNNLLDVDAAVNLMNEFIGEAPTFAVLKHNNACGVAQRSNLHQAYVDALAGDPVSAFGGVLISNSEIDVSTAEEIHKLFCEVVIAPSFSPEALTVLKGKKNRILMVQKLSELPASSVRSCLNGYLVQDQYVQASL
jgi:phosphoribosylaminoimidazolecarboxamide formyltransferase/IMP cyclohydrolase